MAFAAAAPDARTVLVERVTKLTRQSRWELAGTVPTPFRTYHPQGMVKIGNHLIVSSVEVRIPTKRFSQVTGGYDRDAGDGVAHLLKFDMSGTLLADLKLGEGTMYHPGGIDYDGTNVWVPVAEYRPNSRSIIYRVNPETMTASRVFTFGDHIGAVVGGDDNTLYGVSWGSRAFYRWTLDRDGKVTNARVPPEALRMLNASHYLDYQDCKYVGGRRMLCTGVTEIPHAAGGSLFRLGGIDLVDLRDGRPVHQVPLLLWTASGLAMTQNAVWLEATRDGARGYFMPDDDGPTVYIYYVKTN